MAKSAVKPIFSPLPHPTFFAPKSPFFALFPVLSPFSGDFSREQSRFLPCEAHLFLLFPVSNPISSNFSRDRSSLFPSHSPFRIARPPFIFRLHLYLFPTPPSSPGLLPFRPSFPLTFTSFPPLSFSFLPTFPSPSPINARSCAPSTTRVRVRLYIPTRQEVFVYCLHRFTHLPQSAVHQHIRCEGKTRKSLHKIHIHLKINILPQTSDFIRRKLHLITAVNPTITTVNLKTKSLHPLCAVPQPFAAYR